jgi:hypothetical protein
MRKSIGIPTAVRGQPEEKVKAAVDGGVTADGQQTLVPRAFR